MVKLALLARLSAKPEKAEEVKSFLESAVALANAERKASSALPRGEVLKARQARLTVSSLFNSRATSGSDSSLPMTARCLAAKSRVSSEAIGESILPN